LSEYIILIRREDGKFDWGRYGGNNEYLYGSNQGYENKLDAVNIAASHNPGIPIYEMVEGKKVLVP